MFEVNDHAVDVVRLERAADARVLPTRAQHEMLDDELAAPGKQIAECLAAVWTFEHVFLVEPDPGEAAPFLAQLVAQTGPFLFLGEQRLPRLKPFLARYDRMLHGHLLGSIRCVSLRRR